MRAAAAHTVAAGLLIALWGAAAVAAEVRTMAVLPVEQVGVAGAMPLVNAVRQAAQKLPAARFRLLSPAHVARVPQRTPCERLCALDAGRALEADYVVTVRVSRAPTGLAGQLALYHTRSNRQVASRQTAAGDLAGLLVALGASADRLFDALRPGGVQAAPAPTPRRVAVAPAVPPATVARPSPPAARPSPAPARPATPHRPTMAERAEIRRQQNVAQAAEDESDWFEFHLAARTDAVWGNGDMFTRYDSVFGAGVEAGFELFGVDLWADALIQGSGQYLFSANVGVDLDFGREVRFTLGLYTGPIFLLFPKQPVEPLELSPNQRTALQAAGISSSTLNALQKGYNDAAEQEAELNRLAAGWNIFRGRMAVEWFVAPVLALGAHGTLGYHYLLSGEDVAADIKYSAIQDVRRDQGLTAEQAQVLQEAVGAQRVDVENLGGLNFVGGVYLKLSL